VLAFHAYYGHLREQRPEAAIAEMEESLELMRELGGDRDVAAALQNLGMVCAGVDGRRQDAERRFTEAVEIAQRIGDPVVLSASEGNLGVFLVDSGAHDRALPHLDRALATARDLGRASDVAWLLESRAVALVLSGSPDAEGAVREALEQAHALGERLNISLTLLLRAALLARDEPLEAAKLVGAVGAIRADLDHGFEPIEERLLGETVALPEAALGKAQCDEAGAAGAALPLDDVVAIALTR
jgi:tetratricopeptide (TPR) repeat protein